jgi:hypothetical protein
MGRTGFIFLFSVLIAVTFVSVAAAQSVSPSAATLAVKPLKVDIESPKAWQPLGERATYDVVLKDASNRPAKAEHVTTIDVNCLDASGKIVQQTEVQIRKGESKADFACQAQQPGPLRMEARQKENQLLGGKAVIFVTPPAQPPVTAIEKPHKLSDKPGALLLQPGVRFLAVAQVPQPPRAAAYHLGLLPGETDALANGSSEVKFQVCFTQGNQAHPRTVVLYRHDGSTSDSRLEIAANQPCGSAVLMSHTPGKVTVRIVSATVGLLGMGAIDPPNQITFAFHKIIADFRLDDPRPAMSMIESADLVARFYDEQNHVTSSGEDRIVTFSLAGAGLFQPQPVEVAANESEARTTLFPTYWGPARISAATNTLPTAAPKTIVVGVIQVLFLAIVGGAIGALISYAQFRDVLWWRVFVGVVTGLFFVWLSISRFIPKLPPALVHTVVSGFFLALAGGYVGLPVIDRFLKLVGLRRLRPQVGH